MLNLSQNIQIGNYTIDIEGTDEPFITLFFGGTENHASFKFQSEKVQKDWLAIFPFRTYFKSGRKKWYEKLGRTFAMVFRREDVEVLPEKGYSYVKCRINGVTVTLNVSGGTSGGGKYWTDYVGKTPRTSVNIKVGDLKKIAEKALRKEQIDPTYSVWGELNQKKSERKALGYQQRKNLEVVKVVYYIHGLNSTKRYTVLGLIRKGYEVVDQYENHFYLPFDRVDWEKVYEDYFAPKQVAVA